MSEDDLVEETAPSADDFRSLLLLPDTASLIAGKTVSFESRGVLPYDRTSAVTDRGTWTIADTTILGPYEDGTQGRFRARAPGSTTVTFTLGPNSVSGTIVVAEKILEILKISESAVDMPIEGSQGAYIPSSIPIKVFGIYSDGSTEDLTADAIWSSDDETNFVSKGLGLFQANGPTTTQLHAKVNEVSSSIPVAVKSKDRNFLNFSITPSPLILPRNTNMPILIKANYSNGDSDDVSLLATLQSDNNARYSITSGTNVQLRGLVAGTANLAVSFDGQQIVYPVTVVSAEPQSLVVSSPTKNFVFAKGDKERFTAALLYSDGVTQDITSLTTWLSDDITILNKTGTGEDYGYFATLKAGTTTLAATFGAFTTVSNVTVNSAALVSIAITSNESGNIGQFTSRTFIAKGTYSDGIVRTLNGTAAIWTWVRGGVETAFTTGGLLTGSATAVQGAVTIKVKNGAAGTVFASLPVTIGIPVPVSIDITPATDEFYIDRTITAGMVPLVATVTYSDGSVATKTTETTWDYDIITDPNTFAGYVRTDAGHVGEMTPLATGRFQVTASFGGVSITKIVRVTP